MSDDPLTWSDIMKFAISCLVLAVVSLAPLTVEAARRQVMVPQTTYSYQVPQRVSHHASYDRPSRQVYVGPWTNAAHRADFKAAHAYP